MPRTQVDCLFDVKGFWYIVVTPSNDSYSYIITVDTVTGNPFFTGIPYIDIFTDHGIAVKSLTDTGAELRYQGEGLIGLVVVNNAATIGLVTKTEVTAKLPYNNKYHKLKTFTETILIHIPLRGNTTKTSPFEDFHINHKHYFCETYDLTHLFPSTQICNTNDKCFRDVDKTFIWNSGWKKPFEKLGIPQVCIDMIQGACFTKEFEGFSLTYIARRASLNPGTRYAARGLNDNNYPGNEVECELIFIKDDEYWTTRWRRGSIPIRWQTLMSSAISSPKHQVAKDFMRGTSNYFKNLQERYSFGPENEIRCISLLKTDEDSSEREINECYKKAIDCLNESNQGFGKLMFVPFDLEKRLKNSGKDETLYPFLAVINPLVINDGFTHGKIYRSGENLYPGTVSERQSGIVRVNCADSLDRTNLATFYIAMRAAAQWCKEMKLGLSKFPPSDLTRPELILDKRIIEFLVIIFVKTGNIISKLYTNTNAIKINAIRFFAPNAVGISNDASISVKRKVHNAINDPARQKLIEFWTFPPDLKWNHRLNQRYVFFVPNESEHFPRDVFISYNIRKYEISSKKATLCLPCPMIVRSFFILLYPYDAKQFPLRVTVSGGMNLNNMLFLSHIDLPQVENPMWCRFKVRNAGRYAITPGRCGYSRFLTLEFDNSINKSFIIGPIRIEAISIYSGISSRIYSNRDLDFLMNMDTPENILKYKNALNELSTTDISFHDVLKLELLRYDLNISDEAIFNLSVSNGLNPWVINGRSRIIASSINQCAFCDSPLFNQQITYFCSSPEVPGLIIKDSGNSSVSETRFPVCQKCLSLAEQLSNKTNNYISKFGKEIEEFLPEFKNYNVFSINKGKIETYSCDTTAAFLNNGNDNTLIWPEGGICNIYKDQIHTFELFILQPAIILKITVESTSYNFNIFGENGQEIPNVHQNPFEYEFREHPIGQKIKFSIRANEDIVLKMLHVYYISTEYPFDSNKYMPNNKKPITQKIPSNYLTSLFDLSKRTEVFMLTSKSKVEAVQIEYVIENGISTPLSLCFAFYNKGDLLSSKNIVIPQAPLGSKIWINFAENTVADNIRVFYLDRVPTLKPHILKFLVQKIG